MSNLTHVAGTFLIQAEGAFLNGAGLGAGEDRNVTVPKMLQRGGKQLPYVSAQSWRRWLRNTVCDETGWPVSELRAIDLSEKGTTNKISGELNPVDFPEDDIFGYMRAESGQGKSKEKKSEDLFGDEEVEVDKPSRTKAVMRTSPFLSSILMSVRRDGKCSSYDEGFVHLKEGTPLPYKTQFYNTDLQSVFCLDYSRLGRFVNLGDRIELDGGRISKWLAEGKIVEAEDHGSLGKVYELSNRIEERKKRAGELLKAIAVLRGGAKQAAFGTDVAPKVVIAAGLTCGNPIFNNIFEMSDVGLTLKIETLKEIASDYADRITTPVFVGIRTGYLANEDEVRALPEMFIVTTPVQAMTKLAELLP
jgi:CRISPR-associated protein Cst2